MLTASHFPDLSAGTERNLEHDAVRRSKASRSNRSPAQAALLTRTAPRAHRLVRWTDPDWDRPATVGQYLPKARSDGPHDPRKHAIALTYVVILTGTASPRGEAIGFDWFTIASLPLDEMGFGQEIVVRRLLQQLSDTRAYVSRS